MEPETKRIVNALTLAQKAALLSGKSTFETFGIKKLGIPDLFLSDGPSGLRKQEGAADHLGLHGSVPATCFPSGATLANSWDPKVTEQVGAALAAEAQAHHVQVVLGPAMCLKRDPRGGRSFEYYSEDPYLTGKLAAGYVRGIQHNGTIATPKHFAANQQELKRMASNSVVDARALHELYLTGFEIAVKEGHPRALMSSYNRINGVYANENPALLQKTLRDDWGFKGFVVSDWGGSNDHVAGVKAGSNLEMPSTGMDGPQQLIDAVKSGQLDEAVLNQRVGEYLDVARHTTADTKPQPIDWAKQHAIARNAATQSIVLLKNDHQRLPLNPQSKVAVLGDFAQTPRYQGAGSSQVNAHKVENFWAEAQGHLNLTGFEPGFRRVDEPDAHLQEQALALAAESDVALVFIGLNEAQETEGKDRLTIDLPTNQLALLQALHAQGTPTIAVVSAGAVVDMHWADQVDAIVHGYLGGEAGASAMLAVLTGAVNPSGKLAESYPVQLTDVPFTSEFPGNGHNVLYKESLYVGYRYYDKVAMPVAFPFGFGLSYTSFAYSALKVDAQGAHFTLTNTGHFTGAEIAQLYVASPDRQLYHPLRELKGFTKVTLKPGESQQVTIPFDDKTFRAWDPATEAWVTPGGTYTITVGASSRDLRLKADYHVVGVTPTAQTGLKPYFTGEVTKASAKQIATLLNLPQTQVAETPGVMTMASTIGELTTAKSHLARLVPRVMAHKIAKLDAKGQSSLDLLFTYNMPFRGIQKMTNGLMDTAMVAALLTIVNGHFWHGLMALIRAYFHNQKRNKVLTKQLEEDGR